MAAAKYDWTHIWMRREVDKATWDEIAKEVGAPSGKGLRTQASARKVSAARKVSESGTDPFDPEFGASEDTPPGDVPGNERLLDKSITGEEMKRLKSVKDVLEFYDVDPNMWDVRQFWLTGNSWDQSADFVCHQYKIKVHLVQKMEAKVEQARLEIAEIVAEFSAHQPKVYARSKSPYIITRSHEDCMAVFAVFDPHIGMRADARETGINYDTKIAVHDYEEAAGTLCDFAAGYPIKKLVYTVGHDLMHANAVDRKTPVTAHGTPQDMDNRLGHVQTQTRIVVVKGIDLAIGVCDDIDVEVVQGNHDPDQTYSMGEILNAWYRTVDGVDIGYSLRKRRFYNWFRNTFMFTHGEEYKRHRDNLVTIFPNECPADMWVASEGGCREVLTGHSHINMEGRYVPTFEVDESRAVRTRSLPGMTATDKWHSDQGYEHRRAATVLIYRKSGGVEGLHEWTPSS